MMYQLVAKGTIEHELFIGSLDGTPPKRVPITINSRALYVQGQLLFVRDGTLLAQPFALGKAHFTGEAKPLVDDLHYFRNTGLAAFTVSENGVLAWRVARRPSRLVWVDRTGIELKLVGTAPFHHAGRLSPDGRRFAAAIVDPKQGVSDVWIYDLERDSSERLTYRLLDEGAPVWGPDGKTIYYRNDSGPGPPDIYQWPLGDVEGKPLHLGPGVEEPQDVSPDGKWLLFVDHRTSAAADINLFPLDPPGPPRPFVATPFNETSPRFSPDGQWVAYASDASGRPEVYVRPLEGSAAAMRISKDGGTRPRFSRDGRELYFLAPGGRLMVSAGLGIPRMLFQAADAVDYEPSPDASRFLLQLEEGSSEPPIHLLINWPARL
jgi:dipeptidyl aminopeptidase/acylaminoacyl peptidase